MKAAIVSFALCAVLLTAAPQWTESTGITPEKAEALSWQARRDLESGDLRKASAEADAVLYESRGLLKGRPLDSTPSLATAVGAAYEVQAQVLDAQGRRAEAIQLLRSAMRQWSGTSITTRLQKNLNLLSIQGRRMPALNTTEWIGKKRPTPASALRGKVVLLFFWADWCPDCKAEAPVLAKLAAELQSKGLIVIAPTQFYGFTPTNDHAPPAEEKAFIERVFQTFYAEIPGIVVPLNSENFQRFGASTTPTLVLVDRKGIVRLYHPGVMGEAALVSALRPLINS